MTNSHSLDGEAGFSAFDTILDLTVTGLTQAPVATTPLQMLVIVVSAMMLSIVLAEGLDRVRLRPAPPRRAP